MAELEVSFFCDERKCSNQEQCLYRQSIFNMILSGCFLHYFWKKKLPNKAEFFQNTMNFESGFNNFENFFFFAR